MLQNATPLRKSAPSPPNSSDEDVSCTAGKCIFADPLQMSHACRLPSIAFGNATKPSHFAHFWQGAQSLAPATRKHIWTSKNAPYPSVFSTFDFEMCVAPQRRALFRHLNFQKWSENGVFCTFWLGNVLRATTACTFSTSELPKVVRTWCVLYILTWKCASRHSGVHFFDIATAKSGPELVLCTFCLRNVLRATTACTFSTSQLPKVVRPWCALYILTWKCASRHNGVHFFISHLASWLRTRRFSEPTFRPSGATNHWKNAVFLRLSYLFARLDLLSSETFSSLICSLLLFSSLCLFPSLLFICPYCRKFDS